MNKELTRREVVAALKHCRPNYVTCKDCILYLKELPYSGVCYEVVMRYAAKMLEDDGTTIKVLSDLVSKGGE